jgi:two-component system, LuxR family, sensor kinase FixL
MSGMAPESNEIRAIVEGAGTMIVATDPDGIVWLFNPAAERMLGWTAEEVIGKKTPALWHVHDEIVSRAAELSQKLGREIQPGSKYFETLHEIGDHQPSTWTIVRKDGTRLPCQLLISPWHDHEGRFAGLVGTAQDLTVRVNIELELEQRALRSERFARATLDALTKHISVIDSTGKIVSTNRAWKQFAEENNGLWMSMSEEANYLEVCDRSAANGDRDARTVADAIRQVIAGEIETWAFEYPCHSNSVQRWFTCRVTKCQDLEASYVVIAHEDITARYLAERALRLSEERLSTLLRTANDAVVTIDESGILQSFNHAAETMFGYSAHEAVGQSIGILVPPFYRIDIKFYLKKYQETGVRKMIGTPREVSGQRRDGTVFPLELSVSEVDHLKVYMGVMRDLTSRKQLERRIVETASLEQQRIGQDLHDSIGQQLTGTIMLCQVLLDSARAIQPQEHKSVPNEVAKAGQQVFALAQRLQSCVEEALQNIRDLCRILSPVPITADGLKVALEQLVAKTSDQSSAACTFECPQPICLSDNLTATHLFNIAQGALSNAVRHAKASHIQMRIEQTDNQIVLAIRDDGIGLPALNVPGLGMRIMQNRSQIIGATLVIRAVEPTGTEVTCICHDISHLSKSSLKHE